MFDRDWITNEQIWNHDFESSFGPFITNELSVDVIRSVNVSEEDDGIDLLRAAIGGIGIDDVGT